MILIIDNYDSFTYNLYQSIMPFYSDVRVVRNDKVSLQEIHQLEPKGIILSPGPGRPEESGVCIEIVQSLISGYLNPRMSLLGVCLGHQIITVALGGQVIQSPEIMHGKNDLIFHHRKNIYQNLSLPFQAGRYHSLITERSTLPSTLLIEAENAAGTIMGIRHVKLPIYGVQFHPESILTPSGSLLLEHFVKQCTYHEVAEKC